MTINTEYSLKSLAELLGVEFLGDPQTSVTGLAPLADAKQGQLSFYHNPRFAKDLAQTQASVVIVDSVASSQCPSACLLSSNPYALYARVSLLFEQRHNQEAGIDKTAIIHPSAIIGDGVRVEANVVIEKDVVLADDVVIQANSVIGQACRIGKGTRIYPNVIFYPGVSIGENGIVHASVVIGADGFGYAPDGQEYRKIAQLGSVRIGNNVDIGASTTIDRGALNDTVIEDGVKIDNQVQIAHNVQIGANTIICGCSAIAGSSIIGKNCTIAGGVGIINHITLVDDVTITAMSLVNQDVKEKGVYSSGTGLSATKDWKKSIVRFKELDEMSKRLGIIEKQLLSKDIIE